jgi:tripartite-type tricarboxylate transporter receptor subunit TctC
VKQRGLTRIASKGKAMKHISTVVSLLLCIGGSSSLFGQGYPSRPIRLVVPFPAGESIDATARATAQHWSAALGQQIIVDNRGGAGGTIGSDVVAKSAADGYTLLWGNVGPLAIGPSLYSKLPYDVIKNFAPVSQATTLPFVMFVSPAVAANTVGEFIAYAKARPKELNFGSTGVGSGIHLITEMFKMQTGLDMVHVPYKGVAQAMPEIIAGRLQVAFNTIPAFLPHVKAGRLKALVITSAKRSALLPQVPSAPEAGLPQLMGSSWHAVVAPAGTPAPVVLKLHQTLVTALGVSELRELLISQGAEPVGSSPQEFAKFLRAELAKWRPIVEASGAKAD